MRRALTAALAALLFFSLPAEVSTAMDPRSPAACFHAAGGRYGVPPALLWAIAWQESRHNPAAVNRNRNGSYDYGVMQINSSWYRELGPERWAALGDPCYNVHVGAWVLARCMAAHGDTWRAVGCYHSPDPKRAAAYAARIRALLGRMGVQP